MRTSLVDGFAADSVALAERLLAAPGRVVLVGEGAVPESARALLSRGLEVATRAAAPAADIAYVDVWTAPASPWVTGLRSTGTTISSLADVVLREAKARTVAVTGTAGKTTTTTIVAQLLRYAGFAVSASDGARFGNMWPSAVHLDQLDALQAGEILVLELTSSHLAYCSEPVVDVAVLTNFWPDHVELHGSVEAYREAKRVLFRGQRAEAAVVVAAADPAAVELVSVSRARRVGFGLGESGIGAFQEHGELVLRSSSDVVRRPLPALEPWQGPMLGNLLAGAAGALATGATPAAVAEGIAHVSLPPFRATEVGAVSGVPMIDDGMAATPAKTAATLAGFAPRSVVLIAGGYDDLPEGVVHRSPAEQDLLDDACRVVASRARSAVLFGPVGDHLAERLREAGASSLEVVETLDEAVALAVRNASGAAAIVFSPLYPVTSTDRAQFAALAVRHSTR